MSDKTLQGGGPAVEQELSLSGASLPGTRGLSDVVKAEPHALPPTNHLVEAYHLGAVRGLAKLYAEALGVGEERRAALGCPSANIRLVA